MVLLVDIGNSNIVFGIAEDNKLVNSFRIKTFENKTSDEYYLLIKPILDNFKITDVIISSVVPIITSSLKKMFAERYKINPMILGPGIKTGIQLKVDDPKSVGADLICDCVGAAKHYNEALIVDLGTATKYIYIKNNIFYGCSIAPGVSVSMKALVSNAALLPNIELVSPKKVISTNTISCMQSGVIFGAAAQVDGMIERIKDEINNPNISVIATGGLSGLIVPLCKNSIERIENLTVEGLLEIYSKNKMEA